MTDKTDCAERVACEYLNTTTGTCHYPSSDNRPQCPPGAHPPNCTVPTSDGGAAIPPWHDNGACLVPPECEECMVGDAERKLRAENATLRARVAKAETMAEVYRKDWRDAEADLARMTSVYEAVRPIVRLWQDRAAHGGSDLRSPDARALCEAFEKAEAEEGK